LRAATKIKKQLLGIFIKKELPVKTMLETDPRYFTNIKKCILEGFFMKVARFVKQNFYMTVKDS
jgi:hypothetical protein